MQTTLRVLGVRSRACVLPQERKEGRKKEKQEEEEEEEEEEEGK